MLIKSLNSPTPKIQYSPKTNKKDQGQDGLNPLIFVKRNFFHSSRRFSQDQDKKTKEFDIPHSCMGRGNRLENKSEYIKLKDRVSEGSLLSNDRKNNEHFTCRLSDHQYKAINRSIEHLLHKKRKRRKTNGVPQQIVPTDLNVPKTPTCHSIEFNSQTLSKMLKVTKSFKPIHLRTRTEVSPNKIQELQKSRIIQDRSGELEQIEVGFDCKKGEDQKEPNLLGDNANKNIGRRTLIIENEEKNDYENDFAQNKSRSRRRIRRKEPICYQLVQKKKMQSSLRGWTRYGNKTLPEDELYIL